LVILDRPVLAHGTIPVNIPIYSASSNAYSKSVDHVFYLSVCVSVCLSYVMCMYLSEMSKFGMSDCRQSQREIRTEVWNIDVDRSSL